MTSSITLLKSNLSHGGGAEKYAKQLGEALVKRGCNVTCLTTGPEPKDCPFTVISSPSISSLSVGAVWQFDRFCKRYLQKHPTKIVLGLDRNRFQTHLRASSGVHKAYLELRKKQEPWWRGLQHQINPLHRLLLQIEKESFTHPNLQILFTNSHLVRSQILAHYPVDPQKLRVIHNGVQWHAWQDHFAHTTALHDPDRFHFLFVGDNFSRKGLEPLLRGLSLLNHKDFHLMVVGKDKRQGKFQALAHSLGLSPNTISFWNRQDSIIPFLQKADCLVIPSFYDPFANVTVEALAMGLFVISSKTNGGSEMLTSSFLGHVLEELSDPYAMKKALEVAFCHPKTPLAAQKRRLAVQSLDFSTQLNAYIEEILCPQRL